jgi:release factor glutamine methyltransferase
VTIHGLVAAARQRLRQAGIAPDEADLDARLLAQELLGWDAARFFTSASEPPPNGFPAKYEALVARRAAREPLAYLIGRRDFWDLTFEISPAVLVPRPETELIVETALDLFPASIGSLSIADVCTGSGCLAIALATERPGATCVAIDVSAGALEVGRRNAGRHHVADRVRFAQTDLLAGLTSTFDLIVSNPPYVPETDRADLPPEVRDFEPAVALYAGGDGLSVIRRLVGQSVDRLAAGGVLIFEFGTGQARAVSELISATAGLTMTELRQDLQGIPRTAVATRP